MLLAVDVGNTNTVLGLYRLDADAGLPPKGKALPPKERFDTVWPDRNQAPAAAVAEPKVETKRLR